MSDEYLNTEEAMRALKISRITLYRWAKSGKIPFTKVGSTYRFKKDDIEGYMAGDPISVEEPGVILAPSRNPLVITGRDIELWASHGSKVAEEVLPELIRRLLQSSRKDAALTELHMPSGDSISEHGWDGKVYAQNHHMYIPQGASAWEMGVGEPQNKATSDYTKRTADPINVSPANAAFVFVTAQRWSESSMWLAKRAKTLKWSSMRVLDANDLADWLDLAPAVKRWFLGVLKRSQIGITDLETYWEDWRGETNPSLSSAVIIAGRETDKRLLQDSLANAATNPVFINAASKQEAVAFFAASIFDLTDEECSDILSSALVITSQDSWDETVAMSESLTLVAMFDNPERINGAISKGHQVIIPIDRSVNNSTDGVVLGMPKREAIKTELRAIGVAEKDVDKLSSLGRHSILSLWRRLAVSGSIKAPDWADNSEVLAPASFLGMWDEKNDADKGVVAELAGKSYDDYIQNLETLRHKGDSPVGKVGNKWYVASKEDVWNLLSIKVDSKTVERFVSVSIKILSEIDPAYEMPYKDRWLARVYDKKPAYSHELRKNIADTLAFLASRYEKITIGKMDGENIAKTVMADVFDKAQNDNTGHLWASLCDVMPLLSEATPIELLSALEKAAKKKPSNLAFIFQDKEEDSSSLGSSSPHTGVLWALENLAWSSAYLLRVTNLLARLNEMDPGGKLSNRPIGSMKDIYLSWHPQTGASVAERIEVLKGILDKYPQTGWQLLVAILPERNSYTTGSHSPKWREWKPEEQVVTHGDLYQLVETVSALLLDHAGYDGQHWADILESYDTIYPERQDLIANKLTLIDLDRLPDPERLILWNALRNVVYKNKRYSKQSWAVKEEKIDTLLPALSHLEPTNITDQYGWLFSHHVDLPLEDDNYEKYEIDVRDARHKAVKEIYSEGGLELLVQLDGVVESSYYLGVSVGQTDILKDEGYTDILRLLGKDMKPAGFAHGVIVGRFYPADWAWADECIKICDDLGDPIIKGNFLSLLPLSLRTWELVDAGEKAAQKQYWTACSIYGLDDVIGFTRLVEEKLKVGQPYAAIDVLAHHIEDQEKPAPDLVLRSFEKFITSDPEKTGKVDYSMFSYHTAKLLKYLDEQKDLDNSRLARIEWALLPVMKRDRKPRVLHEELATNPIFFSEIVGWVYRKRGAEKTKLTKEEESRARQGYELLESWNIIPGTKDGKVDQIALMRWITEARGLLAESGRAEVGDQIIGKMLATSKVDEDGVWPIVAIRNVIEEVESDELEEGIRTAVFNSRGVTSRSIGEGGGQERELVKKYELYAEKMKFKNSRTAYIMLKIADMWRYEAERHDNDAIEDEIA